MRIYLAAMFMDKDIIAARGAELETIGIVFTSHWVKETASHTATINDFPDEYFRETAEIDLDDILGSDKLIMFCPTDTQLVDIPVRSAARGGRHFEAGMFYGLILADIAYKGSTDRELILVGKRENVFHFLDGLGAANNHPTIRHFDSWDETLAALNEEVTRER